MALDHPVAQRVHDQPQRVRVDRVERVARAREVHVEALILRREAVVALVVDALEGEHRAEVVALRGVVVDHVEDHLDPALVERLDHALELADLLAGLAGRRVRRVRREVADRGVAPVVLQAALEEERLVDDVMDGQELDRGHAELAEVIDRRLGGEAAVGPAQVLAHVGVLHREALDVGLVDDRVAPAAAGRCVVLPVEAVVDDQALRDRGSGVLVVGLVVGVVRAVRGVRQDLRQAPVDLPLDRLRVRVDQELARVEPVAVVGLVGAVDAVAVALARMHAGQVAVPVVVRDPGELDPLLLALRGEEAELDALGVLGEDREVRPLAVPGRAERVGLPRPDLSLGVLGGGRGRGLRRGHEGSHLPARACP